MTKVSDTGESKRIVINTTSIFLEEAEWMTDVLVDR